MSTLKQTSSGSTTSIGDQRYEGMDERKRKRMISNRESAKRSRMRKQKIVEDLRNEVSRIQCENNEIVGQIDETSMGYMVFLTQNNVLRAQLEELTERYRSWISLLKITGLNLEILDIPDPLLKPCPSQPVLASSTFFQS
ncbi:hypothetical protein CsSME_00010612 [Camellia sinensis var. sinensis]